MASVGPGNCVVVVLNVGGTKALDIKLVLQRETQTRKYWVPAGFVLLKSMPLDAVERELFQEAGLIVTVDDLTLLSGAVVRVPLHARKDQLAYVYTASVHTPHVNAYLRTPAKVKHVAMA
jgi:ADP-ribose pyrophosphatase YjhB (NUDIX family)